MKHLKILALAVMAAGALMAFIGAGTASATTLCSTTVTTCPSAQKLTGSLTFTLTSTTQTIWRETSAPGGEGNTLDQCGSSEVGNSISNSGSSTSTVTGSISTLTWGSCSFPTSTTLKGGIEIHQISGTSNGTVTSDGESRVTINTIFFGTCVYSSTSGKSLGDLTEGNPAIFHANAVTTRTSGSEAVCHETSIWSATYTLTSPATTVSVSAG